MTAFSYFWYVSQANMQVVLSLVCPRSSTISNDSPSRYFIVFGRSYPSEGFRPKSLSCRRSEDSIVTEHSQPISSQGSVPGQDTLSEASRRLRCLFMGFWPKTFFWSVPRQRRVIFDLLHPKAILLPFYPWSQIRVLQLLLKSVSFSKGRDLPKVNVDLDSFGFMDVSLSAELIKPAQHSCSK